MWHPNGKYYKYSLGEARVKAVEDAIIQNGEAIINLHYYNYGPRMTKENAIRYYNSKLRPYWLQNLDDSIPLNKRDAVLDYLLGVNK